jgi:hypothetical protein
LIIVIDYELLKPVPAFLTLYLKEVRSKISGMNTIILTRSNAKLINQVLRANPTLQIIPHFIVQNKQYKRFKWEEPLSYVLVDKELKINFVESAFDVHSMSVLDKAINELMSAEY